MKILRKKLDDKFNEINAHCDKYGLRRDYSRELVKEQIVKKNLKIADERGIIKNTREMANSLRKPPHTILSEKTDFTIEK